MPPLCCARRVLEAAQEQERRARDAAAADLADAPAGPPAAAQSRALKPLRARQKKARAAAASAAVAAAAAIGCSSTKSGQQPGAEMERPKTPDAAASGKREVAVPQPPGHSSGCVTQSAPSGRAGEFADTQAASAAAAVTGPPSMESQPRRAHAAEPGCSDGASAAELEACGADFQQSKPQRPPQEAQSQPEGEWQQRRSRRRQQHPRPAAERFADCVPVPAPSPVDADGSALESGPSHAEPPAEDGGGCAAADAAAAIDTGGQAAADAAAAAPASAAGRGSAVANAAASCMQPALQPRGRTWAALAEGDPRHGHPQQSPQPRQIRHDQHGPTRHGSTHPGRQQRQPGARDTADLQKSALGRQGRAGTPAAVTTLTAAAAPAAASQRAGRSGDLGHHRQSVSQKNDKSVSRTGRSTSQTAKSHSQTTSRRSSQRDQPGKAPRDDQAAAWQAREAGGAPPAAAAAPGLQGLQAWPLLAGGPDWFEVRPLLVTCV